MSLLLIDDQGEFWDGQSRRLREAFDSPYSGGEFSDYTVANLGFIAINSYGASCQVRLRPSVVTDASMRALRQWLARSQAERVVISWLGTQWSSELHRRGGRIQERLDQLVTGERSPAPGQFLARETRIEQLHPKSPLGVLMRQWPRLSLPNGQHTLMQILEATLGNRYVVVKPGESGKLLFQKFGGGLYAEYETWRNCAVGAPIEEQPDRNFGRWVSSAYQAALDKNAPQIDDVDAIVRWPHAGRARMRYKRIIVPLSSPSEGPLVLGGSLIDPSIDLRVGRR